MFSVFTKILTFAQYEIYNIVPICFCQKFIRQSYFFGEIPKCNTFYSNFNHIFFRFKINTLFNFHGANVRRNSDICKKNAKKIFFFVTHWKSISYNSVKSTFVLKTDNILSVFM